MEYGVKNTMKTNKVRNVKNNKGFLLFSWYVEDSCRTENPEDGYIGYFLSKEEAISEMKTYISDLDIGPEVIDEGFTFYIFDIAEQRWIRPVIKLAFSTKVSITWEANP